MLLVLASLIFSCKKKSEDPTIFEGKVVYADDNNPVAGVKVSIIPILKTTPLTAGKSGDNKYHLTGENGSFKIEFPYDENVKYFGMVTGTTINGEIKIINSGNGLDCSPYDCLNFKPHQNYNNLIIKIPRP